MSSQKWWWKYCTGSCDVPHSNLKVHFLSFLRCLTAQAPSCPTSTRAQTRCMGRRVWRSRLKVTWLLLIRGTTALKCIATCSSAPALLLSLSLSYCFAHSAEVKPLNQTIEGERKAPEHFSFQKLLVFFIYNDELDLTIVSSGCGRGIYVISTHCTVSHV